MYNRQNELDKATEIVGVRPLGRLQKARKDAKFLAKRWFIEAFTGMAQGLFVTLIAGLIIKQIGILIGADTLVGGFCVTAGNIASMLTGAGIGAGIASHLKAPKLVVFGAMVAGFIGAFSTEFISGDIITAGLVKAAPGNPIGAYVCSLFATEIGMLICGKTKLDILLVPLVIITATIVAVYLCIPAVKAINYLSKVIDLATKAQPFIMGVVISAVVGLLLTMPTSSAAICIALKLGGIAGGAAVVGCAAHMVGFAVAGFRENKWSGLISQGIGTSMLQIPNIMKKPIILLPAVISSLIVGPIATCVFKLQCNPAGSGMGTSGFVGVIATLEASTNIPLWQTWLGILVCFIIIPVAVSLIVSELLRKKGLIKFGDMGLNYNN